MYTTFHPQVVELEQFQTLVLQDAEEVKGRQETDSVQVVDDLRHHISCGVQTISGIQEARTKLATLEALLEELGIEA